ncbi:hypothetical protein [Amycolatopsis thermoflava]|uniref:hypothetical protein n=1 Tax=Amycolatopsis thermoflava TaxID=84480 RepID=UPI0037F70A02
MFDEETFAPVAAVTVAADEENAVDRGCGRSSRRAAAPTPGGAARRGAGIAPRRAGIRFRRRRADAATALGWGLVNAVAADRSHNDDNVRLGVRDHAFRTKSRPEFRGR